MNWNLSDNKIAYTIVCPAGGALFQSSDDPFAAHNSNKPYFIRLENTTQVASFTFRHMQVFEFRNIHVDRNVKPCIDNFWSQVYSCHLLKGFSFSSQLMQAPTPSPPSASLTPPEGKKKERKKKKEMCTLRPVPPTTQNKRYIHLLA